MDEKSGLPQREGALVAQAEVLKEGLSPKELEIFLHLGEYCIEKGSDSFLDRQYFPVADELEDFFELLVENGILAKAGRSDRGIAGFVWKLHRENYEQVRAMVAPRQRNVAGEEKKSPEQILKDSLVARLLPHELTYFLNLPQNIVIENGRMYWDFTSYEDADEQYLALSIQEKKEISQLLIQIGVASKEKDGTVVQIDKKKYLEVWNLLTGKNIEGLERNVTVLFQSLFVLEQIFESQKERNFDEAACVTLFLEQLSVQCDWKSINQKIAQNILQNLFENGFLQKNDDGNITITERGYEYLGIKRVILENQSIEPQGEIEKTSDEPFEERVFVPEEISENFVETSIAGGNISDGGDSSSDLGQSVSIRKGSEGSKKPKGVRKRGEFIPKKSEKTADELEKDANELLRQNKPIAQQHEEALQRMLEQAFDAGKRDLYDHQIPMIQDFITYLQTVVERRAESGVMQGEKDVSFTRARIVSAPRTGKTTVAAEIIRQSGLKSIYFVPSSNLVTQAKKELAHLLAGKKVVAYGGGFKENLSGADVIVVTYNQGLTDMRRTETLPPEVLSAALVFTDEGHESTTAKKTKMLDLFHNDSLKIALSGTPDYSEERTLETFYPYKIHELTTREAVEMDLLAPFRYWTYEVGVDGSRVSFDRGDYNDGQMGKIMSELPFFQFCSAIRYSQNNKSTPALLVCKTQEQALELAKYLRKVQPEGSKRIGVVLHERGQGNTLNDNSREQKLQDFENGEIDTLITVRVLLRGWDSKKCKLLIDMAPTASPIQAGQKYTRPLTKGEDENGTSLEASIYTLIPQNLAIEPVLPSDVLESYGVDVEGISGSFSGEREKTKKHVFQKTVDALPDSIDGIKMKLVVRNQEYGGLGRKKFDNKDSQILHDIILTAFEPETDENKRERKEKILRTLNGYFLFRDTLFNHPQFRGYGRTLLYLCGIKNSEEYKKFITGIFPEEAADILLNVSEGSKYIFSNTALDKQRADEQSVTVDAEKLFEAIRKNRNKDGVWDGYAALLGGQEILERDPFLLSLVQKVLNKLTSLSKDILYRYYFLGQLQTDIASDLGMSRSRPGQIMDQAFRDIRRGLLAETIPYAEKYKEMRELLGFEEKENIVKDSSVVKVESPEKMKKEFLVHLKSILFVSVLEQISTKSGEIHKQIRTFIDEFVDGLTREEQEELYSNFVDKRIDLKKSGKVRVLFGEKYTEFVRKMREIEHREQERKNLVSDMIRNIVQIFNLKHKYRSLGTMAQYKSVRNGFIGVEKIDENGLLGKIREFCREYVSKLVDDDVGYLISHLSVRPDLIYSYTHVRDKFIEECRNKYQVYDSL